jgi:hypothetical protein
MTLDLKNATPGRRNGVIRAFRTARPVQVNGQWVRIVALNLPEGRALAIQPNLFWAWYIGNTVRTAIEFIRRLFR